MPVKKYLIEIADNPEIARIVGIAVKEVRKKNVDTAKRKRVIIDTDVAKAVPPAGGNPGKWVMKLRRAANDPAVAGDMRVVANIIHIVVFDRYEKMIDRIIRRIRVPPTP